MIYITSDTHIPEDVYKLNTKNFPEQKNLTKNDHLIICGDFGAVWNNSREDNYWRRWLNDKKFTTLFIDGNHENFDLLDTFPIVNFCGGRAHRIDDSIYHLMRGEVYTIEGKSFFTMGGASSHDKQYRTEGETWWKAELPTESEITHAINSLQACNFKVDYILTHCAPSSLQQKLAPQYGNNILTDFLEEVMQRTNYKHWFFGHYHKDKTIDNKHTAVFDIIIPLN